MSNQNTQNLGIIGAANRAFAESFAANLEDKSYTLILTKKSTDEQKTESGSATEEFDVSEGIVGAMLPEDSVINVTRRIKHNRGAIYEAWDGSRNMIGKDYYIDYNQKPSGGPHGVYLCLNNNNGALSTSPPTGTSPNPIETEDGYLWQYLYSITGNMQRFLTNKWLPVPKKLTKEDYDGLAKTDPKLLMRDVDDRMSSVAGGIIRFHIDGYMKDVRWTNTPKIIIKQQPQNPAEIELILEHYSNLPVSTENGYEIKKIRIIDSGKGYTQPFNNLLLKEEPSAPSNVTADVVVGSSSLPDGTKGPLIYPVLYPKIFDRVSLLNAHTVMVAVHIPSDKLREQTDVTTFNSVGLIENLYVRDEEGNAVPIQNKHEQKQSSPSYIRMSDKITITGTGTSNIVVDNNLESAAASGYTIRSTGDVVSKTVGTDTVIEVSRSSRDFEAGEKIYNSSVAKPSTIISSIAGVNLAELSKAEQITASYIGSTTTNQIAKIDKGVGELGEKSKVLYTAPLPTGDVTATSGMHGIMIRFIVGN